MKRGDLSIEEEERLLKTKWKKRTLNIKNNLNALAKEFEEHGYELDFVFLMKDTLNKKSQGSLRTSKTAEKIVASGKGKLAEDFFNKGIRYNSKDFIFCDERKGAFEQDNDEIMRLSNSAHTKGKKKNSETEEINDNMEIELQDENIENQSDYRPTQSRGKKRKSISKRRLASSAIRTEAEIQEDFITDTHSEETDGSERGTVQRGHGAGSKKSKEKVLSKEKKRREDLVDRNQARQKQSEINSKYTI